ncbi:histidine kinase [Chitinophaga niastensis]|uniref:Histidine kinase n=1 Tax=Chitinophaga niastensis TaxID=536980 RepID=A0A2P8HEV6_CHINA|nr:histidine kinase [Chitinophaga niastensis]PSL44743.1 histidine kinase [Chitinophaga niastensis]
MKFFMKFIFPAIYGLTVYLTIRLLNDSVAQIKFWERPWTLNALEIAISIFIGYVEIFLFTRLLRYFDRQQQVLNIYYGRIVKELGWLILINLALQNLVFTPMAALTDDGLSWGDLADINVIPMLYAVIYYGIARSSQFLNAYVDNRIQLERVTNEQLETELKFLKAQYHPHFLFNAINTVYFQMDEDVDGAKKTLEKFSELLRYQLYDQQQQVPVIQEIDYLNNYVDIQKIRSSTQLALAVEIDDRLQQQRVYPLLFLPLIENAFKYVGGDYQLHIKLALQGNDIILAVSNSLHAMIPVKENGAGIGLENLQRRLQLLYPGKHRFTASRQDHLFIAALQLEITNDAS